MKVLLNGIGVMRLELKQYADIHNVLYIHK